MTAINRIFTHNTIIINIVIIFTIIIVILDAIITCAMGPPCISRDARLVGGPGNPEQKMLISVKFKDDDDDDWNLFATCSCSSQEGKGRVVRIVEVWKQDILI